MFPTTSASITFSLFETQQLLSEFFFVCARVSAMTLMAPVIGTRLVPSRVKLVFILALSFAVMPAVSFSPTFDLVSLQTVITLFFQVIIGVVIGFVLQVVFQIFTMMGEISAMQSGLGMAVMNDPSSNASVPVVSQFFLILVTFLFLVLDGHLVLIQLTVESFQYAPIGTTGFEIDAYHGVSNLVAWMMASAFKIALPLVISTLMLQVTIGVMTKAAPQLNIFSVGFPITMIFAMFFLWVHVSCIYPHFIEAFDHGETLVRDFLGDPNG